MNFIEEDPSGHPYHSLAYGDKDGPEDAVLFVDFFRMDPPVGDDHYGAIFKMFGKQVVVPESILKMAMSEGWNYKSRPHKFTCEHKHDLMDPNDDPPAGDWHTA